MDHPVLDMCVRVSCPCQTVQELQVRAPCKCNNGRDMCVRAFHHGHTALEMGCTLHANLTGHSEGEMCAPMRLKLDRWSEFIYLFIYFFVYVCFSVCAMGTSACAVVYIRIYVLVYVIWARVPVQLCM